MAGATRFRTLWETHYGDADAVVFVVDASDRMRLCQVRDSHALLPDRKTTGQRAMSRRLAAEVPSSVQDELQTMLEHEDMRQSTMPLLIFCNKMDLPGALTPAECVESLELEKIRDRPWHIAASNALTGEGVGEGILWLAETILEAPESKADAKWDGGGGGGSGGSKK
eukprot:scaffold335_cov253-Pinguiococcus_pyrenoidosus.AAC.6